MAEKYSVIPEEGGIITEQLLKNLSMADANENSVYKDLIVAKVVSIIVLGLVSFLLGIFPIQLAKWFHWKINYCQNKGNNSRVISLLLCFGGGVLLFTTFIHLQPEVREDIDNLVEEGKAPKFEQLADLVFCMGFFFVYLIEELVHGILDRKHDNSEDVTLIHRTVSLRRCGKAKEENDESNVNQGIIPRVTLPQTNDEKPAEMGTKSASTQILLDSLSISTINNPGSFEQNYPSKFSPLDPENQMTGMKCHYPVSKPNEKIFENSNRKDIYENNFHATGRTSNSPSHSHIFFDGDNSEGDGTSVKLANTLRGFFTVLALSFHAVFEGLAVGLENQVSNVWYLFLAIATHKFVISFCVGIDLLSTRTKKILVVIYLGTFAFVTPLGIGVGIFLSDDPTKSGSELSTAILQGMAAGTLLYVVFFEVLQRERANEQSGILQLIAILAGFGVMFALQFITGHHHHHHHHHKHSGSLDVSHLLKTEEPEQHAHHHHHH